MCRVRYKMQKELMRKEDRNRLQEISEALFVIISLKSTIFHLLNFKKYLQKCQTSSGLGTMGWGAIVEAQII